MLLFPDPVRRGMSPVHEAIQEALVNSLIHADHHGQGGIVIERFSDRIELNNPGNLLVSLEQWSHGAVSECRNPRLQLMFQLLGTGDKAGSGVDKIRQGWASQKWRWPRIEVRYQPDRVNLVLSMTSLLPNESLAKLRHFNGFDTLRGNEVEALATADLEGFVTNERLQQFSMEHTTDITKMLQILVAKGFLIKSGYGRWAKYHLADRDGIGNSAHSEKSSMRNGKNSMRNGESSVRNDANSMRNEPDQDESVLWEIAAPVREKSRLPSEAIREIIRRLCTGRYLTLSQIGHFMNRNPAGLRNRFIQDMLKNDELITLHSEPNHPQQAYMANEDWAKSG